MDGVLRLQLEAVLRMLIGRRLALVLVTVLSTRAAAQVRVNPTGVSVNAMDATTVFLTYGGLRSQRPVEAFWCGELVAAAPARGSKCDPTTIFGQLPLRYDLSSLGTGTFTDIMSIPASVARLAYQAAARGATSTFFYVRRFQSTTGAPDEYVAVTCRLTGGGARSPFALTDVREEFASGELVPFIAPGETPPKFSARITFNGTGRLVGRWEVVLPGETAPSTRDLLTEATLPPAERGAQRHFAQLQRFNIFLPPDGRVTLPGPDVGLLPSSVEGTYLVLLRIEASDDRENDSNLGDAGSGTGILHSGAVAGFPMPVLRYVVAGPGARTIADDASGLRLLGPATGDTLGANGFTAMWVPGGKTRARFYRLELETDNGTSLLSALLPSGARRYDVPSWVGERAAGRAVRWRVTSIDGSGTQTEASAWRILRPSTTLSSSPTSRGAPR
jgi:hypothetical protein